MGARAHDVADIERLAERAVERLCRAGAGGDVHVARSSGLVAELVRGKLRNSRAEGRLHLSVRAVQDGRIGFYSTTDFADPTEAVRRALEVAATGEQLELEFPAGDAPACASEPRTFDGQLAGYGPADMADFVQGLAGRTTDAAPGAQVEAAGGRVVFQSVLANTAGGRFRRQATRLEVVLQVSRFSSEDVLFMYQGHGSARLGDEGFAGLPARVGELYAAAGSPAQLSPGKRRVVFAPEAVGVLLGPMFAGVNGTNVNLGTSPLAGRTGEQLLDSRLTLSDDPWLDWSSSSAPWDDEGVATNRKDIFRDGVLCSYLHDLRSAAKGKTCSTANGRRQSGRPPQIAPFNVVVRPGRYGLADLFREAEDGLYVCSVIGGMDGILAGAFSNPVGLAYLVKDGQLAGRVKDVAISGNVYELCRDGLVGIEDRTHPGGISPGGSQALVPHILLDGVDLSGQ